MGEGFEEVITTRQRLRELMKAPGPRVSKKTIDHIDDICQRFIAACPFVMVASRSDKLEKGVTGNGSGLAGKRGLDFHRRSPRGPRGLLKQEKNKWLDITQR